MFALCAWSVCIICQHVCAKHILMPWDRSVADVCGSLSIARKVLFPPPVPLAINYTISGSVGRKQVYG